MLKGITTIELTDIESGEVNVVQEENFITNALPRLCQPILRNQDTLATTLFRSEGGISTEALLRGLLLFDSNLGESPNTVIPPLGVKMVGHGGEGTYAGSDLTLGSFNSNQSDLVSPNERTYVWDFTAEQANGIINSVCLTTQVGGQIGYGSNMKPERSASSLKQFSNITKSKMRVVSNAASNPRTRMPVYLSFTNDEMIFFNVDRFTLGELVF